MIKAYLKAISHYLPEKILSNEDLVKEFPEWTVDKITTKIGIRKRYIAAETETAGDMAQKAAENLFRDHNINPAEIDFIILCTQSPDYFLPTTACILQDKLNIPRTSGAIDFNLGCSGYIYGLALAKGLIAGSIAQNILLLTSETYSKHMHPSDKVNRSIFSDAATATLISSSGFAEILDFELGTDGRGAENLIVKSGGLRACKKTGTINFDENGNPKSDDFLYMDGLEVFNFTLAAVPVLVAGTLKKNKMISDDIEMYIFHQANKYMLEFLRKKIGIPESKFFYCLEDFGNTISSTIPIALINAISENKIQKGTNILLSGFGVGYSYGGTVLRF